MTNKVINFFKESQFVFLFPPKKGPSSSKPDKPSNTSSTERTRTEKPNKPTDTSPSTEGKESRNTEEQEITPETQKQKDQQEITPETQKQQDQQEITPETQETPSSTYKKERKRIDDNNNEDLFKSEIILNDSYKELKLLQKQINQISNLYKKQPESINILNQKTTTTENNIKNIKNNISELSQEQDPSKRKKMQENIMNNTPKIAIELNEIKQNLNNFTYTYTIKEGESVWLIAKWEKKRTGTSMSTKDLATIICQMNDIESPVLSTSGLIKDTKIPTGKKLIIPLVPINDITPKPLKENGILIPKTSNKEITENSLDKNIIEEIKIDIISEKQIYILPNTDKSISSEELHKIFKNKIDNTNKST